MQQWEEKGILRKSLKDSSWNNIFPSTAQTVTFRIKATLQEQRIIFHL